MSRSMSGEERDMASQSQPVLAPKSAIGDIIAKLEGASGPDRELDVLIAAALHPSPTAEPHPRMEGRYRFKDVFGTWDSKSSRLVTASLDATFALVEETFPGAVWIVERSGGEWRPGYRHFARVARPFSGKGDHEDGRPAGKGDAPSAPIAVLLALFRALEAQ